MVDSLDLFYWDACIFYEYLRDEQVDPLKKQAIVRLLSENKQKRNRICTSAITHLEVFPRKLGTDLEKLYSDRFQTVNFFDIEVDRSVISLAREIKDFYFVQNDSVTGYKMLSTGDAIHLATAVIHNANEFHTRDKNSKGGNIKLLGLPESSPNGKLCGQYPLRVIDPKADQGDLF